MKYLPSFCRTVLFGLFLFPLITTPIHAGEVEITPQGTFIFTDNNDKSNLIIFRDNRGNYIIEDLTNLIYVNNSYCAGNNSFLVICDKDQINKIELRLGGGDDTVEITTIDDELTIYANGGNDEITINLDGVEVEEDIFVDGGNGDNILILEGTDETENIEINESNGDLIIKRELPNPDIDIRVQDFQDIIIDLKGGDDFVTFDRDVENIDDLNDVKMTILGGHGKDTLNAQRVISGVFDNYFLILNGGPGDDKILSGEGREVINCGGGFDQVIDLDKKNDDIGYFCDNNTYPNMDRIYNLFLTLNSTVLNPLNKGLDINLD